MGRYINADILIQDIVQNKKNNNHNNAIAAQTHNAEHRHFIKMVLDQPVIEIVRCKDCKYGRPIDKTKAPERYYRDDTIVCECEDIVGDEPMVYLDSHFCSYGKQR